jgi:hypothetical protein
MCLTFSVVSIYGITKFIKSYDEHKYSYKDILELFDYFLSKSFDTLYEMDLISHITNNASLTSEERETYERNFIKRTMLYMGKRNLNMIIKFFGDKETVVVNMLRYMRKRINDDGLSKIIQNQQSELQQ